MPLAFRPPTSSEVELFDRSGVCQTNFFAGIAGGVFVFAAFVPEPRKVRVRRRVPEERLPMLQGVSECVLS